MVGGLLVASISFNFVSLYTFKSENITHDMNNYFDLIGKYLADPQGEKKG